AAERRGAVAHRPRVQLAADTAEMFTVEEVADPRLADLEEAIRREQDGAGGTEVDVALVECHPVGGRERIEQPEVRAEAHDAVAVVVGAGARAVSAREIQAAVAR